MSEQDDIQMDVYTIDLNPDGTDNTNRNLTDHDEEYDNYSYNDHDEHTEHTEDSTVQLVDDLEDETIMKVSICGLYRYLTAVDKLLLLLAIFASICCGVIYPALAIISGQFTRDVLGVDIMPKIINLTIIFLYLGVAIFVTSYVNITLWMVVSERLVRRIRERYLKAIFSHEIGWHDLQNVGDIVIVKLASNTVKIREGTGEQLGQVIQSLAGFLGGLGIAFYYGWELTLVIAACTPVLIICTGIVSVFMSAATTQEQLQSSEAGAVASESIGAVQTVQSLRLEDYTSRKYLDKISAVLLKSIRKGWIQGISVGVFMLVIFCIYGFGFYYGAILIRDGKSAWPGTLYDGATILTIFYSLMLSVTVLGQSMPNLRTISTAQVCAYPLYEIIERQSQIDPFSEEGIVLKPTMLTGRIYIRTVCFSYPARPDQNVLDDITMTFTPGLNAIIGSSGCGKSSVLQLLARFYDPYIGTISVECKNDELPESISGTMSNDDQHTMLPRIDRMGDANHSPTHAAADDTHTVVPSSSNDNMRNISLPQLNTRSWRSHIAMVPQEPTLFSGTIRDNLILAKPDATDAELVRATKMAAIYDFICTLEDGFESSVGDQGRLLSQGQRQRIAIARAFLVNPVVLLLDEFCSALDVESSKLVHESLHRWLNHEDEDDDDNDGGDNGDGDGRTTRQQNTTPGTANNGAPQGSRSSGNNPTRTTTTTTTTQQKKDRIPRTCIMVTHKISTIKKAKKIIVMEQGMVVENGTHDELLLLRGNYYHLLRSQGGHRDTNLGTELFHDDDSDLGMPDNAVLQANFSGFSHGTQYTAGGGGIAGAPRYSGGMMRPSVQKKYVLNLMRKDQSIDDLEDFGDNIPYVPPPSSSPPKRKKRVKRRQQQQQYQQQDGEPDTNTGMGSIDDSKDDSVPPSNHQHRTTGEITSLGIPYRPTEKRTIPMNELDLSIGDNHPDIPSNTAIYHGGGDNASIASTDTIPLSDFNTVCDKDSDHGSDGTFHSLHQPRIRLQQQHGRAQRQQQQRIGKGQDAAQNTDTDRTAAGTDEDDDDSVTSSQFQSIIQSTAAPSLQLTAEDGVERAQSSRPNGQGTRKMVKPPRRFSHFGPEPRRNIDPMAYFFPVPKHQQAELERSMTQQAKAQKHEEYIKTYGKQIHDDLARYTASNMALSMHQPNNHPQHRRSVLERGNHHQRSSTDGNNSVTGDGSSVEELSPRMKIPETGSLKNLGLARVNTPRKGKVFKEKTLAPNTPGTAAATGGTGGAGGTNHPKLLRESQRKVPTTAGAGFAAARPLPNRPSQSTGPRLTDAQYSRNSYHNDGRLSENSGIIYPAPSFGRYSSGMTMSGRGSDATLPILSPTHSRDLGRTTTSFADDRGRLTLANTPRMSRQVSTSDHSVISARDLAQAASPQDMEVLAQALALSPPTTMVADQLTPSSSSRQTYIFPDHDIATNPSFNGSIPVHSGGHTGNTSLGTVPSPRQPRALSPTSLQPRPSGTLMLTRPEMVERKTTRNKVRYSVTSIGDGLRRTGLAAALSPSSPENETFYSMSSVKKSDQNDKRTRLVLPSTSQGFYGNSLDSKQLRSTFYNSPLSNEELATARSGVDTAGGDTSSYYNTVGGSSYYTVAGSSSDVLRSSTAGQSIPRVVKKQQQQPYTNINDIFDEELEDIADGHDNTAIARQATPTDVRADNATAQGSVSYPHHQSSSPPDSTTHLIRPGNDAGPLQPNTVSLRPEEPHLAPSGAGTLTKTADGQDIEVSAKANTIQRVLDQEDKMASKTEVFFVVKRITSLLMPYKLLIFFGTICALIEGLAMPLYSLLMTEMVKAFFLPDTGEMMDKAMLAAVYFICVGIGYLIVGTLRIALLTRAAECVILTVRNNTFISIINQDMAWHDDENNSVGLLTTKLANDAGYIRNLVVEYYGSFMLTLSNVIASFAISYSSGWEQSTLMLGLFPIITACAVVQHYALASANKHTKIILHEATRHINEMILSIRVVALFRLENNIVTQFIVSLFKNYRAEVKNAHIAGFSTSFSYLMLFGCYALTFYFGGVMVDKGRMHGLNMLKIFMAIQISSTMVAGQFQVIPQFGKTCRSCYDIFEIMDREPVRKVYTNLNYDMIQAFLESYNGHGGSNHVLLDGRLDKGTTLVPIVSSNHQNSSASYSQQDDSYATAHSIGDHPHSPGGSPPQHGAGVSPTPASIIPITSRNASGSITSTGPIITTGGGPHRNSVYSLTNSARGGRDSAVLTVNSSTSGSVTIAQLARNVRKAPSPADFTSLMTTCTVRFHNVRFAYPTRPNHVIYNRINLSLIPGTNALVGPSGCGKSSIFNLIQRFYDPCPLHHIFGDDLNLQPAFSLLQQLVYGANQSSHPVATVNRTNTTVPATFHEHEASITTSVIGDEQRNSAALANTQVTTDGHRHRPMSGVVAATSLSTSPASISEHDPELHSPRSSAAAMEPVISISSGTYHSPRHPASSQAQHAHQSSTTPATPAGEGGNNPDHVTITIPPTRSRPTSATSTTSGSKSGGAASRTPSSQQSSTTSAKTIQATKEYIQDSLASGVITVNDIDIKTLPIPLLRSLFGIVSQVPVLFSGTIMENIKCGDTSITDEQVYEAGRQANIHDLIMSRFPQQYQTELGPNGKQLSGGQKARIAIARAIVSQPKILLLDEVTASLDPRSEKLVQEALNKAVVGRTTVIIAHRLDTVLQCDNIIVMDQGRVVESGNHQELMQLDGLYATMIQSALSQGLSSIGMHVETF